MVVLKVVLLAESKVLQWDVKKVASKVAWMVVCLACYSVDQLVVYWV